MTFFKEGDNPQPGIPNADVHAFTFGVRLASGKVTPCTTDGQRAEFVFNDTVEAVENGFGVGLLSKTHSGGIGVPVLAGGVIAQGAEICVGMVEFTDNAGVTLDLPVAVAAADAEDGAWIIGKASLGSSASEADTDVNAPSIALEFYDVPQQVVGGQSSFSVISLPVSLPDIAAGDFFTDWTPDFDGEIVSIDFAVTEAVTTAGAAADLNAEINGTNVTGGVVGLTSANATPVGKVIAGSAVTANNVFAAGQTVSFEAANVTAFTEGAGNLLVTVKSTVV
jgi:hypothetical protein